MKFLIILLMLSAGLCIFAAEKITSDSIVLQTLYVESASKWEQEIKNVPSQVIGITNQQIEFQNSQTTADMLQNTGQVFVQKSQTGGGSPVLRGFEANRVLLVVDGVRMNNAIYRGGHLQDVITLDNSVLDKTEVLFGPSSTLYGSDALGGVMCFYTKNPILKARKLNFDIKSSSANKEKTYHFDINIGKEKWASLTSFNYSHFGDLRVGSHFDSKYGNWGKDMYYVTRDYTTNIDVVNLNPKPNVMVGSAYKQIDLLQKVLFKPTQDVSHLLNLQFSTNIGNVPRYDRLLELTNNQPTYAQWDYGPQTRFLGSYTIDVNTHTKYYDDAKFIFSYQAVSQDRISRKLNKTARKTQMEDVSVYGLNFDLMKEINEKNILYYGFEESLNTVNSTVSNINIVTGENAAPAATRYPDGGNIWNSAALYLQGNHTLNEIASLTAGIRMNSVYMKSRFLNDRNAGNAIFPFNEAGVNAFAPSGNLALVVNLPSKTKISAILSTGFRAPNIDDMVKFFDNTNSSTVVVPNTTLKPEYAYNAELNFEQSLGEIGKIDAGLYYTLLDNAMAVQATTFNGKDSVEVDGKMLKAVSVQNAESGNISGYYVNLMISPAKHWNLTANITSTYGKYTQTDGTQVPMDHIPPTFGKLGLEYKKGNFQTEYYIRFSAAKRLEDYSPSGEDNLNQTPVVNGAYVGTPAWYTLNVKAGYKLFGNRLGIFTGVENILDRHYRQFASGLSAPGRNTYTTLRIYL